MTRIGLVLGAGGVLGQAYHCGVLTALAEHAGFRPDTAEVIVGTSAGSITGTLIRLGVEPADLAPWSARAPLDEGRVPLRRGAPAPPMEPFRPADLARAPRRPPAEMVRRAVVRPWQFRPMAAGLALLAPGRVDIGAHLNALVELDDVPWPERDLWICAVRRRDGRRVVFGRPGSPEAPLHLAMAASCSIPGYFAPVRIGEYSYVDGGAHSPTNAGVLRQRGLDLVVAISPMSGPPGSRPDLFAASRRHSARLLRREVAALRKAGTPVVVFRPDEPVQAAMGNDMMSRRRFPGVVDAASVSTIARLQDAQVNELMQLAAR